MTDRWTDRLSDYLDDELTGDERAALDRHLAECGACRDDLARLARVTDWAAAYEGRPPRTDPWPAIRRAMDTRTPPVDAMPIARRGWRHRTVRLGAPLALAASLLFATVSGVTWWIARTTAPERTAQPADAMAIRSAAAVTLHAAETYGVAIGELERALVDQPERLDSTTVRVLREKLATIDAAIAEALDALAQDPASGFLADHFAELMRRKLELLRNVASTASFES